MKKGKIIDLIFKITTTVFALTVVVIVILMIYNMIKQSMPAFNKFGLKFLTDTIWDPLAEKFGALPFIYGTIVSSMIALFIAVPFSLGAVLFLSEIAPEWIKEPVSFLIELLAAIPSIIYGLWGIFVLIPILRNYVEPFLAKYFGYLPFFKGEFYGCGMLAGGIILSIMIVPTISSISKDVFNSVPQTQREAALAIGATKWETIKLTVLNYSKTGVLGAIILGLGRALGETMAVTMVIGNCPKISLSLFEPSYTIASVIANEFTEATSDLYISVLVEIGLILFIITIILNVCARLLVWSVSGKLKGKVIE